MFSSYQTLNIYDRTKPLQYEITDSDFVVVVNAQDDIGTLPISAAVGWEYARRNLPVAKNLALLCLYMEKRLGKNINKIMFWQNEICPDYIDNWSKIAAERDQILNKLSAMK